MPAAATQLMTMQFVNIQAMLLQARLGSLQTDVSGGSGETETVKTGETDESGDRADTADRLKAQSGFLLRVHRNNSGGHAYGNANVKAPALLLDQTKTMPVTGCD